MNFKAVSDDDEDDEEDGSGDVGNGRDVMRNDMMVDAEQPRSVNQLNLEATAEAEDGWVQVTSRRSRGTRN